MRVMILIIIAVSTQSMPELFLPWPRSDRETALKPLNPL